MRQIGSNVGTATVNELVGTRHGITSMRIRLTNGFARTFRMAFFFGEKLFRRQSLKPGTHQKHIVVGQL